jgi:hypothetical protein
MGDGMKAPPRLYDRDEPSPCELYSCKNFFRCGMDLLCCDSFIYYVRTGRAVHPMMVVPFRQTKAEKPHLGEEIIATQEKYELMESMSDEHIQMQPLSEDRSKHGVKGSFSPKQADASVWWLRKEPAGRPEEQKSEAGSGE